MAEEMANAGGAAAADTGTQTAADTAGQATTDTAGQTAGQAAEPTAGEGTAPAVSGAGSLLTGDSPATGKDSAGKETAASESWTLEAGDSGLDADRLKQLEDWTKGMGLTKEQAEKIRDSDAENLRKLPALMEQQDTAWQKELMLDKDFGGNNFSATVAHARKALDAYDPTGEAKALLMQSGYGSNPVIVRLLARVGKDMGEDNIVRGGKSGSEVPLEERLWKN